MEVIYVRVFLLCVESVTLWVGAAVVIQVLLPLGFFPWGWPCWIFLIVIVVLLCVSLLVSLMVFILQDCVGNELNPALNGWPHKWRKYLMW